MTKAGQHPYMCTLQADHQPSGNEVLLENFTPDFYRTLQQDKMAVTQQQVFIALNTNSLAKKMSKRTMKEFRLQTLTQNDTVLQKMYMSLI